jgi:hypothetical protein
MTACVSAQLGRTGGIMKRICGTKAIGLFGTPFGVLLPGLLATSALGQTNTFDIVVSNVVSPEQPSATVEV